VASTSGQTIAPPNDRSTRDTLVLVGIGIILLFAVIGVVSAGVFLGSKVTSASKPTTHSNSTTAGDRSAALQDVHRAQSQATKIVAAAQSTGKSIVRHQTSRAQKRAQAIVAAARSQATKTTRSAVAAPSSNSPASTAGGTYSYGYGSTGSSAAPGASGAAGTSTGSTASSGSASVNLGSLPASWLVVGYNATFGSGPGNVGGITVLNRGNKTFSGTAHVIYAKGGQATASFAGLAPGQSEVLPLNGPAYPGGGFSIRVDVP
jgi:hypothetical protein